MKKVKLFGLLALLAIALVFPQLFSNAGIITIAIFTLIFAASASAWNLFSGFTGYLSLGSAAYYGLGAYALAIMCQYWNIQGGYIPFLLVPLAGLVAGIFAIPLGWVILRTRRQTFLVITIAIFFIFQLLAYNLQGITNGSAGIYLPNPPWSPDVFNLPFYYVSLALLLLAMSVAWWVRNSKYGLGLLAIRDDEDRALSLGVKTGTYKLMAYIISAVFAGMAGAMTAYFIGDVFPPFAFDPTYDVNIALMVFLGGVGTLTGPILGAFLLVPLQQYLTLKFGAIAAGFDLLLYGSLFLAVILLLPEGIVPTSRRYWSKWMVYRSTRAKTSPSSGAANQDEALLAEGGGGKG